MTLTPADLITAAGTILAEKGRWCQGALARDKSGVPVSPTSRRARRWDSAGVVYSVTKVKPDDFSDPALNNVGAVLATLERAANRLYGRGHITVNDELGHADTMECFRLAYRMAKHLHFGQGD